MSAPGLNTWQCRALPERDMAAYQGSCETQIIIPSPAGPQEKRAVRASVVLTT
jgi:hypothetical protein